MAMTIGTLVRALILQGTLSNAEILQKVQETFNASKTTVGCIAWYKSDMRKKGLLPAKESTKKMTAEEYKAHLLEELKKFQTVE